MYREPSRPETPTSPPWWRPRASDRDTVAAAALGAGLVILGAVLVVAAVLDVEAARAAPRTMSAWAREHSR
jgi:hypothetical protein